MTAANAARDGLRKGDGLFMAIFSTRDFGSEISCCGEDAGSAESRLSDRLFTKNLNIGFQERYKYYVSAVIYFTRGWGSLGSKIARRQQ
jgi:hypothetical protein